MQRALFLFVIAVSTLAAQSSRAQLGDLGRSLDARRRQAPQHGVARDLASGFEEIRAVLKKLETDGSSDPSPVLRDQQRKLQLSDAAYKAEFARIEATLRQAGLPSDALAQKLASWHEFTAHYQQGMATVLGALDRLSKDAGNHDAAWFQGQVFRGQLAALRSSLGSEPVSRPARIGSEVVAARRVTPAPGKLDVSTLALATDPPTPDDLAPTNTVLLTPDIQARAAAYGKSPAALFAFVYNEIQFTPYYLSVQNSQSVLWSGKANDGDHATLLIALLRASGIPARYVLGYLQVPMADAMNWMGAKDVNGTELLVGLNTYQTDSSDSIQLQHAWVEAWLGTPNGQAWVPMAPSIKNQTIQPGILIPKPSFNRTAFFSTFSNQLATEAYQDQIRAEFLKSYPGGNYNELPYKGTIIPIPASALPTFPYPIQSIQTRSATLPSHTITLGLASASNSKTVYLNSPTLAIPDISLDSLTMSYIPATPADQAVINKYGGLGNTPAALVNLLPQLLLNEQVIMTGTAVPYLNSLTLTFSETFPFETAPRYVYTHSIYAGEQIAVNVWFQQVSDGLVSSRMNEILSRLPSDGSSSTMTDPTTIRELLSYAGLRYFERMGIERQRVYPPLQVLPVQWFPAECLTKASVAATNLFDRPFLGTPVDSGIDCAETTAFAAVDLNAPENGGAQSPTAANPEVVALGFSSSQLENQLWEEVELIPAISAAKGLQLASQAKIPILVINPANSATEIPRLTAPSFIIQSLNTELSSGATITIPQTSIPFGGFNTYAWIVDYTDGGETYYINLTNVAGGGDTGTSQPPSMPPTGDPGPTGDNTVTNGTNQGDPVSISNGNLFQQQTDLSYSSRGPGIAWRRTYNSLSAASDSPFGFGWTHNFNSSLRDNQSSVTYVNESGGVFSFALQSGAYVSPPGLDLTLTKNSSGFALRRKNGTTLLFTAAGKLESITDRNENSVQLSYDQAGRLASIEDALGRSLTIAYNSANHITSIEDFSGRQVSYAYDSNGRLISAKDAAGDVTTYAYASGAVFKNALTSVTTPAGKTTSFEYYANNQVAAITEAGGRTMQFFYLPLANLTMFVDDQGYTSSYYYNALGNVTRVVHPDDTYADYTYSSDAKLLSVTNEAGYVTNFAYDALGNVTKVTDALGNVTQITYDPNFSRITEIIDAREASTKFEYDSKGNLLRISAPLGASANLTYDSFGEVLTFTDGDGNTWTTSLDANGDPVTVTDPLGHATSLHYDNLRRLTGMVDALNNSYSVQHDVLDRITSLTDALGNKTTQQFDADGNVSEVTDPRGATTHFSYDALEDLSAVKDPLGNTTRYNSVTPDCQCTASMNTAQFTDPAGHTKSFTYNFRMQLTQSTDGLGNTTSFAYGARGYPLSKTDGNGNTSTFGHDANGRLTSQTFSDGTTETYTYDSNGNLTSATNENTKLTFTYDALNRLVSVTDGRFPKSIQYTYDHNGHRTALMDSEGGTFTYGFDKSGRPISIASPGGATAEITYDAANRPVAVSYSNGVAAAIKPDGNGHPLSIDWTSKAKAQIAAFQYTYDKNGNPAAITDMAGTHAYAYDSLNRITSAKNPASTAESFTYDGAGNRTASAGSSYKYDAAGRLISAAGVSYTYDNNGNLIKRIDSKGTTTYTYDIQNRLVAINLPGGSTATYKYDALGRRIEKNVGGTVTQYVYDGLNILLEFDGNDKLQARYTHGLNLDQPMMMERGGAMYFYHSDALGSIAAVTDSTGKAVCGYSYDSFGQATACQGLENPYSFAGREYDSESGLYYMRARYYDPATGRFITNDPLDVTQLLLNGQPTSLPWAPQLLNGYSYAANDPVVKRDPLGLKPINITSGPQPYGPINVVALQQAGSPVLLLDQGTLMVPTQVGGGGGLPSTSFMVGTAAIPFVMLATAVQPETLGFTGPMLGQVTTLEEVGVVTEGTVPVVVQATEGTLAPGALGGWVQGVGSNAWGYWIWLAPK